MMPANASVEILPIDMAMDSEGGLCEGTVRVLASRQGMAYTMYEVLKGQDIQQFFHGILAGLRSWE